MLELFEWLARLELLAADPSPLVVERLKRVSAPSPLDFDGTILRLVDTGREAHVFGEVPARLSVIAIPDLANQDDSFDDQAIAAQLGAVLTLATNRRIHVAASDVTLTMEGTDQRTFIPSTLLLDRSLLGPIVGNSQDRFDSTLSSIYGLHGADRDVIGAATELHYAAVLLFDVDPNAAYALAIGGIERLSRAYGSAPAEWSSWEGAERFDTTFKEIGLTDVQSVRLRSEMLRDQQLRIRHTFARYVIDSLPDAFWRLEVEDFTPSLKMEPTGISTFTGMVAGAPIPIGRFVPSDPGVLLRRLLAAYDSRSSYVHAGRGHPAMAATLEQRIGSNETGSGPIEYVGVRAILRTLILSECEKRAEGRPLPNVKLMHA